MRQNKVVKLHNVPNLNIGVIIFVLLFLFLGVQIIRSLNQKHYSVYEVQHSYMDDNISGSAMALRSETLVSTDTSGYINYYIRNGEKVGKNAIVYTLDSTGTLSDMISEASGEDIVLSNAGYAEIQSDIRAFQSYYTDVSFSDVYDFKYELDGEILSIANAQVLDSLTAAGSLGSFAQINAPESGIVTYYQDGYESKKPSDLTNADFDTAGYQRSSLKTGDVLQAGSPVYKLITSEIWNLVLPLSEEDAARLKEDTRVTLYMPNITNVVYGDIEVIQNGDAYFANITLDKLLVNYCNDRYIPIEIVMSKQEGLSVPNSAILEKDVIKVPKDYLTTGSNSSKKKFLNVRTIDENGNMSIQQIAPTIYNSDDTYCYVNPADFAAGAVLVKNDSDQTFNISDAGHATLTGVYYASEGIATFKQIEILTTNDEFAIIKEGVDYSLSMYDRIILDASTVEEGQII